MIQNLQRGKDLGGEHVSGFSGTTLRVVEGFLAEMREHQGGSVEGEEEGQKYVWAEKWERRTKHQALRTKNQTANRG